ncbi:hypothetical protein OCF84_21265 (plasmid) [Shewanella xiamenensis]|uniref:Large polyvalent protein-associated domain-containing protein n=1 Tax=Shewanella xiamenensis TaxID=332186 RepID=A0ABT6UEY1_9GAMM|nr:hypothetical protein [Shewanella xiamenensis]MDI5832593.1 hypothetical protein [Shewanella xiamenensis]WHF57789.1 hypothetical protein OCF84_21265 [Shewanella xiamenensis]
MSNTNELPMSSFGALSQSLSSSVQNEDDFSEIDYSVYERELEGVAADLNSQSSESPEQPSSDSQTTGNAQNSEYENSLANTDFDGPLHDDNAVNSIDSSLQGDSQQVLDAAQQAGATQDANADETSAEHGQVEEMDINEELDLEKQELLIKQIIESSNNSVEELNEKSAQKSSGESSENDNYEAPKKTVNKNELPAFIPSLIVTNDEELELGNPEHSNRKATEQEAEAPLKVEQDKPSFPKELLKTSYKLKLVTHFRFSLKSVEINANDRSMDLHFHSGALIKDFGKDFMASGGSPEELAVAAVKMAKSKGWRFIKAAGEPEYVAALEKECKKSNLGIRHTDATKLQSAVERFRKPSVDSSKAQEQHSAKNAAASPANNPSKEVAKNKENSKSSKSEESVFEPSIGMF